MQSTQMKFHLFVVHFIIFYNQWSFINSKAIVGENAIEAKENDFPFVVSLVEMHKGGAFHICTGTLFTSRNVITSAHCIRNKEISNVQIRAGSIDLRRSVQYPLSSWISYNEWAIKRNIDVEFERNDLAVLKLKTELPITPVVFSEMTNSEIYGIDAVIAGWGIMTNSKISFVMRTVSLKIMTPTECELKISTVHGISIPIGHRLLCSIGEPFALLTYGDSGGPLLYNNKLIGVNSGTCLYRGQPFNPNKVNLHFVINSYREFIDDVSNSI